MTGDYVFRLVQRHPGGVTTRQLMDLTGEPAGLLLSHLTKQANYGKIGRTWAFSDGDAPPRRWCIWRPK